MAFRRPPVAYQAQWLRKHRRVVLLLRLFQQICYEPLRSLLDAAQAGLEPSVTVRPNNKFNEISIESCLGWRKRHGLECCTVAHSCGDAVLGVTKAELFQWVKAMSGNVQCSELDPLMPAVMAETK